MLLNYYNSIVKVKDDLYVVFDCHFRANYSITGTCRELRDLFAHSKIMRDRISDCKANSPKMSGIEGLVFFERVVTCKRYLSVLSTSPTICKMCVHLQSIIDKILQNNGKFVLGADMCPFISILPGLYMALPNYTLRLQKSPGNRPASLFFFLRRKFFQSMKYPLRKSSSHLLQLLQLFQARIRSDFLQC